MFHHHQSDQILSRLPSNRIEAVDFIESFLRIGTNRPIYYLNSITLLNHVNLRMEKVIGRMLMSLRERFKII
jgi:hypothetical protein